jgi:hypothetical protein
LPGNVIVDFGPQISSSRADVVHEVSRWKNRLRAFISGSELSRQKIVR